MNRRGMDLPDELAEGTLDALPLNVAVLDSEGVIVATNAAWLQFGQFNGLGESADTVGRNYLRVTEAADDEHAKRAARGLREVLDRDRETFSLEYPCHSPAEKRWFRMHAGRFTVQDASYVVVAHDDITARKLAEIEVERRNEDLEAFGRLLSHDLRSPLNVAQGHLDLLREDVDSDRIEPIHDAMQRMNALIEDALTVMRGETRSPDRTRVSLQAIAEEAWKTVETREATLDLASDRGFEADPGLLRNVFENLFHNAVEHGGLDVSVTVGALDDGFFVEDDGAGIPEERREDVLKIGETTDPNGTGFGLAIVSRIVENHGWEIAVETGRAGGARFEVRTEPAFPGAE